MNRLMQSPVMQYASRVPATAGLILMSVTFAACHLDAGIASTQLTHSTWVLLLAWLLPLQRRFYTVELRMVIILVALFLTSFLSAFLARDLDDPSYFRPDLIYLYVIGGLGVLSCFTIRKSWMIFGLLFALSMAFLVIIKDLIYGGVRGEHHGMAIPYGILGMITGLIALLFATDKSLGSFIRVILVLAAISGLAASLWSQTRIAWIYGVLWFVVAAVVWLVRTDTGVLRKLVLMSLVTVPLIVITANNNIIQNRVNEAVNDVTMYLDGTNKNTSVGQRFELWKVSLAAIEKSPLSGVGESGFVQLRNTMTRNKEVFVRKNLEHSHNDYLWIAATHGVLSLIFYLIFQLGLLRFYWNNLSLNTTRVAAWSGLTLTTGALFFGLSDIFFSIKISIGYYLIAQMVLIRFVCQQRMTESVPGTS